MIKSIAQKQNIKLFVILGFLMTRHYFEAFEYGTIIYWTLAFLLITAMSISALRTLLVQIQNGETELVKKKVTRLFIHFIVIVGVCVFTYVYFISK